VAFLKNVFRQNVFRWQGTLVLGAALAMALGGAGRVSAAQLKIMPLGDSITEGVETDAGGGVNHGGYRFGLWNLLQSNDSPLKGNVDFVGSQSTPGEHFGGLTGDQDYDADNEGHSGYTVNNIFNNLDGYFSANSPDVILLNIGVNDLAQHHDPASTTGENDLYNLIEKIFYERPSVHLYVSSILGVPDNYVWGPPPGYSDVAAFQAAIQEYNAKIPGLVNTFKALGDNITFVDMYDTLGYSEAENDSASHTDFTWVTNTNQGSLFGKIGPGIHPSWDGYNKMAQTWYNALVPEPGALSVLLLGVLAVRRRRA